MFRKILTLRALCRAFQPMNKNKSIFHYFSLSILRFIVVKIMSVCYQFRKKFNKGVFDYGFGFTL